MVNIYSIRTYYQQWAAKSGITQYLHHLDKNRYAIADRPVPMGDDRFPLQSEKVRNYVRRKVRSYGNSIYDLNDLMAEAAAFTAALRPGCDIIQYLDSEHTLNFLPSLLRRCSLLPGRRPKVVGMFHQPQKVLGDLISATIAENLDHIFLMAQEQVAFFPDHLHDRISVILHGIDTGFFTPGDPAAADRTKFRCITVGNWLRDYETLVAVAERFAEKAEVEFHIVSGHSFKSQPPNVFLHSGISDDELVKLYQKSDLLLMPLNDATANNGILEGIACGLPVLVTDLPATREYLEGAGVVFVGQKDVDGFVRELTALQQNRSRLQAMGEASRARALQLDWNAVSRRYDALYSSIIGAAR